MAAETYVPCLSCHGVNRVRLDTGQEPICGRCKTPLPLHGAVAEADEQGLAALTRQAKLPVVADFWAPWCGPCRSFAPTFSDAARHFAGRVVFVKVNTEAYPGAGARHRVRGIPTLILFADGTERDRVSGALPPPAFDSWLTERI